MKLSSSCTTGSFSRRAQFHGLSCELDLGERGFRSPRKPTAILAQCLTAGVTARIGKSAEYISLYEGADKSLTL
jgi:hypothetical protein